MDAKDNLANLRVASFSYYLNCGEENFVQKIVAPVEDPNIPATISKEISFPVSSGRTISKEISFPVSSGRTISKEISFPVSSGRTISSVPNPSYAINFSHSKDSPDHKLSNNHQVSSFCPRLNDAHENLVLKIKGPVQNPKSELSLPRTFPTQLERIKSTNGEIGVFGADKYFNMKMEYGTRITQDDKNEELTDLPGLKPNSRSGTPSVNSEASTRNSRSALLQNFPRNTSQTKPKRASGRRILASFGCSGTCLGKGTVYITENKREDPGKLYGSKLSQPGPKRGDQFAFPILNSEMQTLNVKKQLEDGNLELLRKSLDVFGSDTMKKGDIAMNLERKLSMLTWDAIPKASSLPTTTIGSTTVCDDDMASDASSDLFEIENISGTGYPILAMQPADDISAGCMTPTTQYAPSEASIEWSVITASAADFSSVISDYDEKNIGASGEITFKSSRSKDLSRKEAPKARPSGLLGCKSQRAASVVETIHRTRVERY